MLKVGGSKTRWSIHEQEIYEFHIEILSWVNLIYAEPSGLPKADDAQNPRVSVYHSRC